MSNDPDVPKEQEFLSPAEERATARTSAPGIALIIVGVLNGLAALYLFVDGIVIMRSPDVVQQQREKIHEAAQAQEKGLSAEEKKQLESQLKFIEDILPWMPQGIAASGGIGLLIAVLTVLGGAKMRALQSYGLCVASAVLTAIPCVSPMACCLLGEIAGVWALIVLTSGSVRAAFR